MRRKLASPLLLPPASQRRVPLKEEEEEKGRRHLRLLLLLLFLFLLGGLCLKASESVRPGACPVTEEAGEHRMLTLSAAKRERGEGQIENSRKPRKASGRSAQSPLGERALQSRTAQK